MGRVGRPNKFQQRQQISVQLDAAEVAVLDQIAEQERNSRSAVAGRIIALFLRQSVRSVEQNVQLADKTAA